MLNGRLNKTREPAGGAKAGSDVNTTDTQRLRTTEGNAPPHSVQVTFLFSETAVLGSMRFEGNSTLDKLSI